MEWLEKTKKLLSVSHKNYSNFLEKYMEWWIENDCGEDARDITSECVFDNVNYDVCATLFAKDTACIAGLEEVIWFLQRQGFFVKSFIQDGDTVVPGQKILEIFGNIKGILLYERVCINLLQRMSGIATATQKMKLKAGESICICATRKTVLGKIDKKAVVIGGGGSHRLGLYDAILVKENHVSYSDFEKIISKISQMSNDVLFAEVEVENLEQCKKVVKFIEKYDPNGKKNWVIMLDNFLLEDIQMASILVENKKIFIEASGNITIDNIENYKNRGVDIISSGALTHSVKSCDFSLLIEK